MTAPATFAPSDLVTELPRLRRYARVLTGEVREADGLLMDTLQHARESLLQEAPRNTLRSRLFALMHETHTGRRTRFLRRPGTIDAGPVIASAAAKPSGLLVHFGLLPVEEREVLLLVAVEGMGYEQIAGVLGVPLATVMSRLKHARDLMRAADSSCSESDRHIGK